MMTATWWRAPPALMEDVGKFLSHFHRDRRGFILACKTTKYQKDFLFLNLKVECVTCGSGLSESLFIIPSFEYLVHRWWPCLGMARRCVLARGSVSLGAGFEASKASICSLCSVFPSCGWPRELSALSATMPRVCCPTSPPWWWWSLVPLEP